jgi:hypothetical protein
MGQLDYFGAAVSGVIRLAAQAGDSELLLSAEIATDPLVAAAIRDAGLVAAVHGSGVRVTT